MNGGQIKVPQPSESYVNLTNIDLDSDQKELLDMGLNCHVLSKPRPHQKRVEIEVLIESILKLAKDGILDVSQRLQPELVAEAGKQRGTFTSSVLQRRHFEAAQRLRNNQEVTIKRADKASILVLILTSEYLEKIDTILEDRTKFQPIQKNPIPELTSKVNKITDVFNAVASGIKFCKIVRRI
ncbi:uncharacterized protein LOC143028224 [Oratosquilla oratoria]|uniref:uncharacterized protein LOC143028224 n=1 Tax=Oratosquilla oratoria TaxID=337810 RepID=UPI003F7587D1